MQKHADSTNNPISNIFNQKNIKKIRLILFILQKRMASEVQIFANWERIQLKKVFWRHFLVMLNGRNFLLRLLSKNVYSPFREFDYDINLCSSFCSTLFRPQFVFDFVFKYFSTTLCFWLCARPNFTILCFQQCVWLFFYLIFSTWCLATFRPYL